jgi:hypothetical protein
MLEELNLAEGRRGVNGANALRRRGIRAFGEISLKAYGRIRYRRQGGRRRGRRERKSELCLLYCRVYWDFEAVEGCERAILPDTKDE